VIKIQTGKAAQLKLKKTLRLNDRKSLSVLFIIAIFNAQVNHSPASEAGEFNVGALFID
jgi:hypothetical protein